MKDFSAFLDMRRYKNCAHKIGSWKYLTIWRPVLPVFPRAQECLISALHLELLSGSCWKSTAAAAHDLILVEVDGKCQWQVPICSWHLHYSDTQSVSWIFLWEGTQIHRTLICDCINIELLVIMRVNVRGVIKKERGFSTCEESSQSSMSLFLQYKYSEV